MSAITAKPALANDPRLRFSFSHASDRAALAVAWQREVGIDLEPIDADLDLRPLVTIACSTSERERLYSLPPERRVEAFLRLWAAKEAYLKAIGLGLFREVRSLEVGFLTGDRAVIHDAEAENAASRWGVRFIDAGADWVAALASTGAEQRTRTFAWPLPPHAPS